MNRLKFQPLCLAIGIVLLNMTVSAEILTDGTMGLVTTLNGDMKISEQLGQSVGNNLFHSFETFNVNTGERATFTGPPSVANIMARVTGQNHSWIDGPLRVDIPNANLYLLNPNGILFGNHARLDISGSFHASTADYLRLGEQGRFSATHLNNSELVTASPEAFGFLDSNPGSITIQDSFIKTDGDKTLSFIGGNLQINDSILFASGGRINLAAVASAGEATFTTSDLAVNTFDKLGTIKLSQTSSKQLQEWSSSEMLKEIGFGFELANIDVTDLKTLGGAGQIFIRASQFVSNKGWIFADTYGNGNGLGIDIFIDGDMHLINGARITADNFGNGQGGKIKVTTTHALSLSGQNMESENFGDSFSTIATNNKGKESIGTGGNISIETPIFEMIPGLIQSATETKGNAGDIIINAQQFLLKGLGLINASTKSFGQAGHIYITTDDITLSNKSSISTSTATNSSGNAGNIQLTTQQLILENGGHINSFSKGTGNAGLINIISNTASLIDDSGISTQAFNAGGGNINLTINDRFYLINNCNISAEAQGIEPHHSGGNITIRGPIFFTFDNSDLITKANLGHGGDITLEDVGRIIPLGNSKIDVSSQFNLNGKLQVNGLELNDNLLLFPPPQFKEELFFDNRCATLTREDFSFVITSRDVSPPTPEDLRIHYNFPQRLENK